MLRPRQTRTYQTQVVVLLQMRVTDFDKRMQPAYRELARALGRLEAAQGRIARKNARAAVKDAQRKLTALMDKHYPGQRKMAKTRKRLSPEQRERQLRKDGWLPIDHRETLLRIAAKGIRVQHVQNANAGTSNTWAPAWAVAIARDMPSKLGLAKRNLRERRAIMTELALQQHDHAQRLVTKQQSIRDRSIPHRSA